MKTLATCAESIETLKLNSFRGATLEEWRDFFEVNQVVTFEFTVDYVEDQDYFFHKYISILPNNLERIGIHFGSKTFMSDDCEEKLLQVQNKTFYCIFYRNLN